MGLLVTIRLGVYGFSLLVSLIVIALSAHMLSQWNKVLESDGLPAGSIGNPFETVPLVAALFTLVYIISLFVIGAVMPTSVMCSIVAEIGPLTLLWVLWLVAAAQITGSNFFVRLGGCQLLDDFGAKLEATQCRELQAVEGFGFLMWLLLFFYQCYLITFATMAHKAGRKVWLVSVPLADAGGGETTTPANNAGVPMTAVAPQKGVVQQQQQQQV